MTRKYIFGWLTGAAIMLAAGQALALEIIPGEPEVDGMEATREQAVPTDAPLAMGRVVAVDGAAGRIILEFRRFRNSCWKAARAFSTSTIRHRSTAWRRATGALRDRPQRPHLYRHPHREQQLRGARHCRLSS